MNAPENIEIICPYCYTKFVTAAPALDRWLPIDAAPKDGTPVFAWRDGWERPTWVRWILNPRTGTEFWNDIEEYDVYELELNPPTHYLNIPPIPKDESPAPS
jgi:hypothetical protein